MAKKVIRFTDIGYNDIFTVADGGKVQIIYADGKKAQGTCEYIDDYHFNLTIDDGGRTNTYHIHQFAEICANNGNTVEPVQPPINSIEQQEDIAFIEHKYGFIEADKFFKTDDGFTELFYNPDATAGGQVVINEISNALIKEAAQFKTADAFFEHINEGCRQSLIDAGTPAFRRTVKELVESKADLEGINKDTMKGLIKAAGIKPKSKETER